MSEDGIGCCTIQKRLKFAPVLQEYRIDTLLKRQTQEILLMPRMFCDSTLDFKQPMLKGLFAFLFHADNAFMPL